MDPKQIAQFYIDAATTTDVESIMDVAKGIFDQPAEYAEFIFSLAEKKKLPLSEELIDLQKVTEASPKQAQQEKERAQAKEIAENLAHISMQYVENLTQGHMPDEPEMLKAAAVMEKMTASLASGQEPGRLTTFDKYLTDCRTYDPDQDFRPALFCIPLPNGTVSYIGARTSRGKTAELLNLAREAITISPTRKALFITLEMSPKQLLTRLALSLIYAHAVANGQERELAKRENPLRDFYHLLQGRDIIASPGGSLEMVNGQREAREILKNALDGQNLMMYDGRRASLAAIIHTIKAQAEKGTLVLIDYIQRLPSPEGVADNTYTRVKGLSDCILTAATSTEAVIIAGAQFNRLQDKDHPESKMRDTFDDASFRESGDLEQDAHCAIGLGWKKTIMMSDFLKS